MPIEMVRVSDERVRQIAVGAGILTVITSMVAGMLMGWRHLPGLLGEWVGTMIGIMTTPFFMEATFVIIGLVTVISINHWRQHKEGDDFVYLEQVAGPDAPKDLPEHAKWAIYKDKPLEVVIPSLLAQAEGAFAVGDFSAATEWIGTMDHGELRQPETLRLRLELAQATGRTDLAKQLEEEIQLSKKSTLSL